MDAADIARPGAAGVRHLACHPVRSGAGDGGENAPPEQVAALRHKYGLDRPLPVQFVRYVADVARGNMGISLFTQRPVAEDLFARLPATLELALYAIAIAVAAGVPLGRRRGRSPRRNRRR